MLTNLRFERNTRYYELFLNKNLFDDWSLSIVNGRINSRLGCIRHENFSTLAEATIRMHDIAKYRTEKRKYHLVRTNYPLHPAGENSNFRTTNNRYSTNTPDYGEFELPILPNVENANILRTNG